MKKKWYTKGYMALFVRQNEGRSKLQEDLAAELQERLRAKPVSDGDLPDGVEDSGFVKNSHQTSSRAWMWLLGFVVAMVTLGIIFFF